MRPMGKHPSLWWAVCWGFIFFFTPAVAGHDITFRGVNGEVIAKVSASMASDGEDTPDTMQLIHDGKQSTTKIEKFEMAEESGGRLQVKEPQKAMEVLLQTKWKYVKCIDSSTICFRHENTIGLDLLSEGHREEQYVALQQRIISTFLGQRMHVLTMTNRGEKTSATITAFFAFNEFQSTVETFWKHIFGDGAIAPSLLILSQPLDTEPSEPELYEPTTLMSTNKEIVPVIERNAKHFVLGTNAWLGLVDHFNGAASIQKVAGLPVFKTKISDLQVVRGQILNMLGTELGPSPTEATESDFVTVRMKKRNRRKGGKHRTGYGQRYRRRRQGKRLRRGRNRR